MRLASAMYASKATQASPKGAVNKMCLLNPDIDDCDEHDDIITLDNGGAIIEITTRNLAETDAILATIVHVENTMR